MSKLVKDLQSLSPKELEQKIAELRKELVEQKRARASGELVNPHAITKTRRSIATVFTLLQSKRSEAASEKKEET